MTVDNLNTDIFFGLSLFSNFKNPFLKFFNSSPFRVSFNSVDSFVFVTISNKSFLIPKGFKKIWKSFDSFSLKSVLDVKISTISNLSVFSMFLKTKSNHLIFSLYSIFNIPFSESDWSICANQQYQQPNMDSY